LDLGLLTIGIVGHGLDLVYPAAHRRIAQQMTGQGGLLTEHPWATPPAREHFPMRNRLIAGLSDAVIVVESGLEGGSMITANFAQAYQRHVFAIPGRIQDSQSQGCNALIRDHKAQLLSDVAELVPALGWEPKTANNPQPMLFPQLNEAETQVIHALLGQESVSLEQLFMKLQWPSAQLSATLLNLEIKGLIKILPGKFYRIR
jgi:DNA processing protein